MTITGQGFITHGMLKRKNCPNCDKTLPVMLFTANRKVGVINESVYFICPACNEVLEARTNDRHQKNFLWILLVPLFATPLIFSLKTFVGPRYLAFYYLFSYGLALMIPTIIGQHQMDFFTSSRQEFDKKSLELKEQKET